MVEIKYTGSNKQQAQLICENSILLSVREHFSASNPAYRRNRSFSQARIYAITPSGKFDIGLLEDIKTYFDTNQIKVKIDEDLFQNYYNGFKNFEIVRFTLMEYRNEADQKGQKKEKESF